jgi:hypothetical protein
MVRVAIANTDDREPATERAARVGRVIDASLAVALAAGVLLVQSLHTLLQHPFWLDEAWVADLVKAPLSRQIALSSSTPVGWAVLLRLVPGRGAQRLRVLPLAFEGATAALAFVFVRGLNWGSVNRGRAAGVIAGGAVLLAPMSIAQNDLKQYSADAALSFVVLCFARRVEQRPGLRPLFWLSAASVIVTPFSSVAVFVVGAAFTGLLVAAALDRRWLDARRVLTFASAVGILNLVYLAVVVLPHDNPALRAYWHSNYLGGSPRHVAASMLARFRGLGPAFGVSPWLPLLLSIIGLFVLVARHHVAVACSVVVLSFELILLAIAGRYPFLDVRTSYFFLAIWVVVASIGFAGVAVSLTRRAPLWLAVIVAMSLTALALGGRHEMRGFAFPREDVRTPTLYVAAHRRQGDVVVVNSGANWGFSYYWPGPGTKTYISSSNVTAGFVSRVDGSDAIFAADRDRTAVLGAMRAALSLWVSLGGTGRIWVVRSHMPPEENFAWLDAERDMHLRATLVTGPPEPLLIIQPHRADAVGHP